MRLHLLGTAGYHPSETRHTACLMVPESGLILDAGSGMFRVRELLSTTSLDIFLTHSHLDHVLGLTFLLGILYETAVKRVTVHGEPQKLESIRQHLFADDLFPVPPRMDWQPLAERTELACGGVVRRFPLRHPGGAVGYRIDWPGRSFAYVTDTTATAEADYWEICRGVDVLVHECYFPDGWEDRAELTGHSCLTPVLRGAKAVQVRRLLLTHLSPLTDTDQACGIPAGRGIFSAVELAHDRQVVDF